MESEPEEQRLQYSRALLEHCLFVLPGPLHEQLVPFREQLIQARTA